MIPPSAIRSNRTPSPPRGEAEPLAACDDAIALLREIADLGTDDDGDVILGADANVHNDRLSRITDFLAEHDQ